ncbi:MAG: PHP domain-containing protein [Anaerolineae bacterium]|nr:PHP domain-containing protein [Anaerolineae bacterium]
MPSEHNRRTVRSIRSEQPASWGRADLHLHTTYSDGYFSPPKSIDIIARYSFMNVIAITDHDTAEGAFMAQDYARRHHPQLEVIIGQEVTTGEGDVVGLFLKKTLPKFSTALEAIEAIHTQGGLAVAVHPFFWGWGMESVKTAILRLPFDAVEVRHGCPLSIPFNAITGLINRWGQRLPALGGSDSHIPYTTGQAFTWFPGQTASDLRRAIEINTVRPGGTTWKVKSMLRKLPVLIEHRFSYHSKQVLPRLE